MVPLYSVPSLEGTSKRPNLSREGFVTDIWSDLFFLKIVSTGLLLAIKARIDLRAPNDFISKELRRSSSVKVAKIFPSISLVSNALLYIPSPESESSLETPEILSSESLPVEKDIFGYFNEEIGVQSDVELSTSESILFILVDSPASCLIESVNPHLMNAITVTC